jgi:prepilin signal peptidase PulO-like enzyme (type II secretory pathway)
MEILIAVFLGLLAGFLVNYLADVLPTQRTLGHPVCAQCGDQLAWPDYLRLSACRKCGAARSWRTYICLAISFGLSLALWFYPPARLGYWLGLALLTYFGIVVVIDFEQRLILHSVSLAGALLGLLIGSLRTNLVTSLLGGLVGLGVMLIFYWFGVLFARYRARKMGHDDGEEALGFGDVTISGVLGLMLGWPLILYGLMIGILAGGLISLGLVLYLVAARRYESMTVFTAYGPYLVLGAALLIYFPQFLSFLSGK